MMYIREGARLRISVGGGMGHGGERVPLTGHSGEGVRLASQELNKQSVIMVLVPSVMRQPE